MPPINGAKKPRRRNARSVRALSLFRSLSRGFQGVQGAAERAMVSSERTTRDPRGRGRSTQRAQDGGRAGRRRRIARVEITRVRFMVPPGGLTYGDEGARETTQTDGPTLVPDEVDSEGEDAAGRQNQSQQLRSVHDAVRSRAPAEAPRTQASERSRQHSGPAPNETATDTNQPEVEATPDDHVDLGEGTDRVPSARGVSQEEQTRGEDEVEETEADHAESMDEFAIEEIDEVKGAAHALLEAGEDSVRAGGGSGFANSTEGAEPSASTTVVTKATDHDEPNGSSASTTVVTKATDHDEPDGSSASTTVVTKATDHDEPDGSSRMDDEVDADSVPASSTELGQPKPNTTAGTGPTSSTATEGSSRDGSRVGAGGVIYVPPERMTRSMKVARLAAKELEKRKALEADAELAATLDKENEEVLGGELSDSVDDDDSAYEEEPKSKISRSRAYEDEPTSKMSRSSASSHASSDFEDDQPARRNRRPNSATKKRPNQKRPNVPHSKLKAKRRREGGSKPDGGFGSRPVKRVRVDSSRPNADAIPNTARLLPKSGKGKARYTGPPSESSDEDEGSDEEGPNRRVKPKTTKVSPKPRVGEKRVRGKSSEYADRGAGSESSGSGSAEEDGGTEQEVLDIPLELLDVQEENVPSRGEFALGMTEEFATWAEFFEELQSFMASRFALFKRRTSTSVKQRNPKITNPREKIPEAFVRYAQTMICTHGMKRQDSEGPVQHRRFHRYTGCTAVVNATVRRCRPGDGVDAFGIRWRARGGHNHALSAQVFAYYREVRLPPTPQMMVDVNRMLRTGSNTTAMLHTIREETGMPVMMRDIQNLIAKVKRERVAGTTEAERLDRHLESFVKLPGNWADVYVDKQSREVRTIAFQSASMRNLFAAAPEVVMVDCTFGTNKNKFVLFSFVVHDLFGKGQYVFHSLIHRETMDNMEDAILAFIRANPKVSEIRAFVVDKDFKERTLLARHFPHARILLCHYHVIIIFAKKVKQLVRGTKREKDELIEVTRALVYAKSAVTYDALKLYLAKQLAKTMDPDDEDHSYTKSPVHDEEDVFSDRDEEDDPDLEDVCFLDDDSVRSVSFKALQNARDDEDVRRGKGHRFFKYFMDNWDCIPDEWVMFRRQNVAHLGNNTNNRIEAKFGGTKRFLKAGMDIEETVRALRQMQSVNEDKYTEALTKTGTRLSYTGDTELDLLLNVVSEHAYELVLAEYTAVKERTVQYSVRESNGNAILKCSVPEYGEDHVEHTVDIAASKCSCLFAQIRLLPCRHVFFYRMYKGLPDVIPLRTINLRWSLRHPGNNIFGGDFPPGQYKLKSAVVRKTPELNEGERYCKALQIMKEIAHVVSRKKPKSFDMWIRSLEKIRASCEQGVVPLLVSDDDLSDAGRGGDADDAAESSQEHGDDDRDVESTKTSRRAASSKLQPERTEETRSDTETTPFKLPPRVQVRYARDRVKTAARRLLVQRIQKEAAEYIKRESIDATTFSLADAQAVLENEGYCYESALPLMIGIPIIRTVTDSVIQKKRPEHVIPDSTAVRFILEHDVLQRLRQESPIEDSAGLVVLVADGRGCLAQHQLKTMEAFHNAMDAVHAVITAIEWVKKNFISAVVGALEKLPLGTVRVSSDLVNGVKLLEIASDEWLSTTTINLILHSLASQHDHVGVVKAEYFTLKNDEMRARTIAASDPFNAKRRRVVSVVNLSNTHWQAFCVDLDTGLCILYDPLCDDLTALRPLKKEVDKLLDLYAPDAEVTYRTFSEEFGTLKQLDGNSCGVFCCVALEIIMRRLPWSADLILPSAVYRARYMGIMATVQRRLADIHLH